MNAVSTHSANLPNWKLAYRMEEAAKATGLSRNTLYRRIGEGKLAARKDGSVTLIEADELRSYIKSLPKFSTASFANVDS